MPSDLHVEPPLGPLLLLELAAAIAAQDSRVPGETDLVRRIAPHYRRADDEARTLVQSILAGAGDIAVTATELHITFAPLSSPHRTAVLAALCAEIDALAPHFPGTRLRVRYTVAAPKPDNSAAG